MIALPGHRFWTDGVSIVASPHVNRTGLVGYRQVTDAHLLALALSSGGALATFDGGVAAIAPDPATAARAVHVIPT